MELRHFITVRITIILFIIVIGCFSGIFLAQSIYAQYEDHDTEGQFEENVEERDLWWYQQRAYPAESIPVDARTNAMKHKLKMRAINPYLEQDGGVTGAQTEVTYSDLISTISGFPGLPFGGVPGPVPGPATGGVCNWVSIGPRNINGRIRSLAIHPTNGNIIYAGAAEGGLWRSTDAGESWYPFMQYELSLAVGAVAIDPVNPTTIYVGTGEPVVSWAMYTHGAPVYEGVGVLKSTDGGVSWTTTGTINNGYIARLVVDPLHPDIVYCAGFPGGLYKSVNGGTSWTLMLAGDVTDLDLNNIFTNILYAGIRNDGVYKSTDTGITWGKLSGGLPASASNRVMLSVCKTNPNFVYAKLDQTVYKSSDGGTTWTNLGNHGSSTYGYWCSYIAVDPANPDIVFAAGVIIEKSTDGGITWSSVTGGSDAEKNALHADQHAMVFDPTNHLRIYAANDGGVYLSTDGAATWKKVSDGLMVTQFYDVGISSATPSMLGGGTQDQGTNLTVGGLTWHKVNGGDGGFLVFHPTDPYTMYGEYQSNYIVKSTNGGASWINATSGLSGSGPWIGAIVMDEANPDTLFTGRQQVFRTIDGAANWVASSPAIGGTVFAIAIAPSNHDIIYAGSDTGQIWRSNDGGVTIGNWQNRTSAPLPNRVIRDIAVDYTNPDIVYLTFSGFNSNTPGTPGHVFRSSNGGLTWTDISGAAGVATSLPDIPVNAIKIDVHDPDTIYAGTDIGIFYKSLASGDWIVFEPGFPNAAVTDLELAKSGDMLIAATHGRGMWQINIAPAASCSPVDIYIRNNFLDTGQQIPTPYNVVDPLSVVRGGAIGEKVWYWLSPDIKVDSQPYDTTYGALFDGVEFDRDLTHNSMYVGEVNHVYVQVINRGPLSVSDVTVKALYADAAAGFPPLPADFWTMFPNDSTDTSHWKPIGTYKIITEIEPARPVILSWDWVPPATTPHCCILVVTDSPSDPIPAGNKVLNVDQVSINDKHVAHKNLEVIDAPPAPFPYSYLLPGEINFNNGTAQWQIYDLVIDRGSFPTEGILNLEFSNLKTLKLLNQSVENLGIVEEGTYTPPSSTSYIMPYQYTYSTIQVIGPSVAAINDVALNPKEEMKARIEVTIPPEAEPGDRYQFTIMQQQGDQILGGSTYEIRVHDEDEWAELKRLSGEINMVNTHFGNYLSGVCSDWRDASFVNTGNISLTIDSITSENDVFRLSAPGLPVILAPWETYDFNVSFCAPGNISRERDYSANIIVAFSGDGDSNIRQIMLDGKAILSRKITYCDYPCQLFYYRYPYSYQYYPYSCQYQRYPYSYQYQNYLGLPYSNYSYNQNIYPYIYYYLPYCSLFQNLYSNYIYRTMY